jgi:hypothetical protein
MHVSHFFHRLSAFHTEVVEFCRHVTPAAEEAAQRQAAIDRVAEVVRSIWPSADVQVFGSFATGALQGMGWGGGIERRITSSSRVGVCEGLLSD